MDNKLKLLGFFPVEVRKNDKLQNISVLKIGRYVKYKLIVPTIPVIFDRIRTTFLGFCIFIWVVDHGLFKSTKETNQTDYSILFIN